MNSVSTVTKDCVAKCAQAEASSSVEVISFMSSGYRQRIGEREADATPLPVILRPPGLRGTGTGPAPEVMTLGQRPVSTAPSVL